MPPCLANRLANPVYTVSITSSDAAVRAVREPSSMAVVTAAVTFSYLTCGIQYSKYRSRVNRQDVGTLELQTHLEQLDE